MNNELLAKIAALQTMPFNQLKKLWREVYETDLPSLNRKWIVSKLAYRIQELALETQRLRLRAAEEKDIPFLVAGLNDWSIAQWLISPPYPYKEEDARWFINWTNTPDEGGFKGKFVIADKTTDEFLGVITLVPEAGRAELGYWLQAAAHKKGYMKEAVKGVVEFAQRTAPNLNALPRSTLKTTARKDASSLTDSNFLTSTSARNAVATAPSTHASTKGNCNATPHVFIRTFHIMAPYIGRYLMNNAMHKT